MGGIEEEFRRTKSQQLRDYQMNENAVLFEYDEQL